MNEQKSLAEAAVAQDPELVTLATQTMTTVYCGVAMFVSMVAILWMGILIRKIKDDPNEPSTDFVSTRPWTSLTIVTVAMLTFVTCFLTIVV